MSRARNAYAAPAWAAEQRVRDVGAKAVLLTLANYADEHFTCFPGQETLAEETEQSVRQVRRQLAYLEALGLFRRQKRYDDKGKRTSDRFLLLLDVVVEVRRDDPRRALLSGEPVQPADDATQAESGDKGSNGLADRLAGSTTGQPGRQSTTGQPGATTGQPERATTGQEWPSNSQENSQEELPVGSARGADGATSDAGHPVIADEPTPTKPKTKRRTAPPETFEITDALRSWATEQAPRVDLDAQTAQWLDHHRARGSLMSDWTACWRTWMRNAERFAARDGGSGRGRPSANRTSAGLTDRDHREMDALFAGGQQ